MDSLSLGQLFSSSQAILNELEETTLASADPAYQEKVRDAENRLNRAYDLVHKLAIFSSNEILDDINTQDLRFLLIPAYLGEIVLKRTGPTETRRPTLELGKRYFHEFLQTCKDHQLLKNASDEARYKYYVEQDGVQRPSLSAAQQRQQKIEQYKREKATEEKIKRLREQLNAIKDEEDNDRDDVERDWVLALVELYILRSLEHLHAIEQELVVLKEMESMSEDRKRMPPRHTEEEEKRRIPPTWGHDKPLLSKDGKPLQPFVITTKREQLRNQVFRPGHSLPTMTIEEYLREEEERGNIIRGGGKPPEEKPEIDDNDEEALNAETMRLREWDEFVEANPRGWGNRGNK